MKKLLLLFAVLTTTALTASAYDFEVDGIYYNILSNEEKSCEVTFRDGAMNSYSGDVVIPSTVAYEGQAYSVTAIGCDALFNCYDLTSVSIPNSVLEIGQLGVASNPNLRSIEIGSSVRKIGWAAFSGCPSLTSVEIPYSVAEIEEEVFEGCYKLNSFTGKFASDDHRCLIDNGKLLAFAPDGLSAYSIPNTVTTIGARAFYGCIDLTQVEFPNSIVNIGENAFGYCTGLTKVTLGKSIKELAQFAFYNCTALESVFLPSTVTDIGNNAFGCCTDLMEIVSLAETPPTIYISTFYQVPRFSAKIYVPEQSLYTYRNAEHWKKFYNFIGIDPAGICNTQMGATSAENNLRSFNLQGQPVSYGFKGIGIRNGRKFLQKQ